MSKKNWVAGLIMGTVLCVVGCSGDSKDTAKFKEPDGPKLHERPAPGAPGPGPAPKSGSSNAPKGAQ